MKFIYMMVLFSSMLFAMQKQIILGSYSVEENAKNALLTVKEQIQNDEKLKDVLDANSTKLMTSLISGYTVVSVNAFDSYADLLPVIKIFKTYYGDAFVLRYPIEDFSKKEDIQIVEMKAKEEVLSASVTLEEDMSEDEILAQEALLAQQVAVEEVVAEEVLEEEVVTEEIPKDDAEKLEDLVQEINEIEEPVAVETAQDINDVMKDVEKRHSENSSSDDSYLLGALALIAILIGGFIIYKRRA